MQIDRYVAERRHKQSVRRKYFWAVIGFLSVYFAVLGIFVFVVRSPAFQAEQISVQGNEAVSTGSIIDLLQANIVRGKWNSLLGFANMLIWPNALPSSALAMVPQLAGVTISENYFLHAINVTVTERQPVAVWCKMAGGTAAASSTPSGPCFWFDDQGIAFARAVDAEGGTILAVHDYSTGNLELGTTVLPPEFVPNLLSILNAIKTSGVGVQEIALRDLSLQEIDVTTTNGPLIRFSLRFPADNDLPVLQSLMAQPGFDALQYIDFTVENRAYYK
jgi:hypothetical protein